MHISGIYIVTDHTADHTTATHEPAHFFSTDAHANSKSPEAGLLGAAAASATTSAAAAPPAAAVPPSAQRPPPATAAPAVRAAAHASAPAAACKCDSSIIAQAGLTLIHAGRPAVISNQQGANLDLERSADAHQWTEAGGACGSQTTAAGSPPARHHRQAVFASPAVRVADLVMSTPVLG